MLFSPQVINVSTLNVNQEASPLLDTHATFVISMTTLQTKIFTTVRSAMCVDLAKVWVLIIATACVVMHVSP